MSWCRLAERSRWRLAASVVDLQQSTRYRVQVKGKVLPYSLPSVGPGVDPGLQAVSPQVSLSHLSGGRLPSFSARPAVTFAAKERHCPSACTKLYCLVTEAHRCDQLAQGCYLAAQQPKLDLTASESQVQCLSH